MDKKTIYENLRTEMNEEFKRGDTYLLSSYTLTIALWTIALQTQNEWIALLPSIILIPLSLRVCDLRYASTFLGAFIANFIEDEIDYGWEKLRERYYEEYPRNKHDNLFGFLGRFGFGILSIASIVIFWALRKMDMAIYNHIWLGHLVVFTQIFIIALQFYVCFKYANTSRIKKPLMKNWKEFYEKYYHSKGDNK